MAYDLKKLLAPFHPEDIEWRVQSCGQKGSKIWAICLAYVTNRAIMGRLDEVFGPMNWCNVFRPGPDGGVVCGISVRDEAAQPMVVWVTKEDGAENSDIEPVKGGLSNAMKRAAVQWGIGRYLYNLDATWAQICGDGRFRGKLKDGTRFQWNPPALPSWALPEGVKSEDVGKVYDYAPEEIPTPPDSEDPAPPTTDSDDRADDSPGATSKQRNYLKAIYGHHKENLAPEAAEKVSNAIKRENLTIQECGAMIDWLIKKYGKPPRKK